MYVCAHVFEWSFLFYSSFFLLSLPHLHLTTHTHSHTHTHTYAQGNNATHADFFQCSMGVMVFVIDAQDDESYSEAIDYFVQVCVCVCVRVCVVMYSEATDHFVQVCVCY
jgi:hypothetical protein